MEWGHRHNDQALRLPEELQAPKPARRVASGHSLSKKYVCHAATSFGVISIGCAAGFSITLTFMVCSAIMSAESEHTEESQ